MDLTEIGFYSEIINDAIKICENLLQDAVKELQDFDGTQQEIDFIKDFDFRERAKDKLRNMNISYDDTTNSFIKAYYESTLEALSDCKTFKGLGISFSNCVNLDDSRIYIEENGSITEYRETGDLTPAMYNAFENKYINKVADVIKEHLKGSEKEYPKEWLSEDLRTEGGIRYVSEFKRSVEQGKPTDEVMKIVSLYATPIEKPTTIERE